MSKKLEYIHNIEKKGGTASLQEKLKAIRNNRKTKNYKRKSEFNMHFKMCKAFRKLVERKKKEESI